MREINCGLLTLILFQTFFGQLFAGRPFRTWPPSPPREGGSSSASSPRTQGVHSGSFSSEDSERPPPTPTRDYDEEDGGEDFLSWRNQKPLHPPRCGLLQELDKNPLSIAEIIILAPYWWRNNRDLTPTCRRELLSALGLRRCIIANENLSCIEGEASAQLFEAWRKSAPGQAFTFEPSNKNYRLGFFSQRECPRNRTWELIGKRFEFCATPCEDSELKAFIRNLTPSALMIFLGIRAPFYLTQIDEDIHTFFPADGSKIIVQRDWVKIERSKATSLSSFSYLINKSVRQAILRLIPPIEQGGLLDLRSAGGRREGRGIPQEPA